MKTKRLYQFAGGMTALAVLASPVVASAASNSTNTTINATVNSVITLSSSGTVAMALTPTSGGVVSSASDNVQVSTNNTNGYTLSLADSDATTNLASGGNTVAAHAGTSSSPTALATNTWGYAVAGGNFSATYSAENSNASSTSKWAGVPATGSPVTLKTTSTTASNDATAVWYGVKVDSSKPNGVYTDTVTYTATTN